MKKGLYKSLVFILFLLLSAGIGNFSNAQLYMGGKAGLTGFKLKGSDVYGGINTKFGANVGFIMGLKLKTDLNLQAELLYSQKGFHQMFTEHIITNTQGTGGLPVTYDTTTKYNNTLTLSYLELPLMVKKSFSFRGGILPYKRETSTVDFDIFGGIYVGYLMSTAASFSSLQSAKTVENDTIRASIDNVEQASYHSFRIGQKMTVKVDSTLGVSPEVASTYIDDSRSISKGMFSIDAGILVGAGLSFEVSGNSKITLDARYSMGLLSIDKTYFNDNLYKITPGVAGDPTIGSIPYKKTVVHTKKSLKNSGFVFNVGYIFYLK